MMANKWSISNWKSAGICVVLCFVYIIMVQTRDVGQLRRRHGHIVNHIVTEYDKSANTMLKALTTQRALSNDSKVVQLVRYLMDPPSQTIVKRSRLLAQTHQSKEVFRLLKEKSGGFFIECGGFDGEQSSNTLWLEEKQHWSGLLIEMDPFYYTQLIGKSRNAWSINACLSPFNYPCEMVYKESSGEGGQLHLPVTADSSDGIAHVGKTRQVPCFPLESMLLALNQTRVDYFSLDVEGFELDVLQTIPFDRLNIGVISVEYRHGRAGKKKYKEFMVAHGYTASKDIRISTKLGVNVADYIFINKRWL